MTFEEKIDRLKHKFPSKDFKDPYIHGTEILKAVERKFIRTKDLRNDLNNLRPGYAIWSENIKNKTELRSIDTKDLNQWLEKLDPNTNYWMVIPRGSHISDKNLIFDCKPNALVALYGITQSSFYLIEKKYNWLLLFELGEMKKTMIYKSSNGPTPFEIDL
jgi:hypothetical protein